MRSFEPLPFVFIFTYTALLLLQILINTPLPSDASPVPFRNRPPLIRFPPQPVKLYPPKPSIGNRVTPQEKEAMKIGLNHMARPAADGVNGAGGKKETTRRWIGEEEGKDVPLVRIFPNGSFTPFTTEETIEFYILRNDQGQGPDVRDPPLEHPAPPGVEETPKPSKERSVYDQSRTCDSSGEWCDMPVEGSQLIAGIGIGSCTYFEPEGIWGKTVTYIAC